MLDSKSSYLKSFKICNLKALNPLEIQNLNALFLIFQFPFFSSFRIQKSNVVNSADKGSWIRLSPVSREMSGRYRCEVTIESLFFTMTKEGHMNVVPPTTTTSTGEHLIRLIQSVRWNQVDLVASRRTGSSAPVSHESIPLV